MLAEIAVDQRLHLGAGKIIGMRLETEAPHDVLAETSDGGFIAMQAKNSLSSSKALTSEYGKTVEQIVRQSEPRRVCRRPFRQSHAAMAGSSSCA
ncbi:MAG: hypothetical protein WA733_11130 [Methylocystis sp.]